MRSGIRQSIRSETESDTIIAAPLLCMMMISMELCKCVNVSVMRLFCAVVVFNVMHNIRLMSVSIY